MAQVPAAIRASDFGARHEEGPIGLGGDGRVIGRRIEARPAGPRLDFRARVEELGPAAGTGTRAFSMLVPEISGEGPLGALLAQDAALLRGEFGPPLRIGLRGRERCQSWTDVMTESTPPGPNTMER